MGAKLMVVTMDKSVYRGFIPVVSNANDLGCLAGPGIHFFLLENRCD